LGEVLAARPYSIIFCLLFFAFSSAGHAQPKKKAASKEVKTTSETAAEFLAKVKQEEKPLPGLPTTATHPQNQPQVTVYFFWASWCEYCEEGYRALVGMQEKLQDKSIGFQACNFDAHLNEGVLKKAKTMTQLNHYMASAKLVNDYPEFKRLPIFIAEDNKTGKIVASTGYSSERFYYFTKNVNRMLNGGVSDEE
jgi:thiol-disulfide isomerase/thioredoxin